MIIYEVNLFPHRKSLPAILQWLPSHINEMLTIEGFLGAQMYELIESQEAPCLVIQYQLSSLDALKCYFEKHSERMRQQGQTLFPEQFTATRRILETRKSWPSVGISDR